MRRPIHMLSAILACLPGIAMPAAASAQTAEQRHIQIVSVDPVVAPGSRDGPVMRITYPAEGSRLPVIILSHGNRLSRMDSLEAFREAA